ncbi:MAG TPA: hypothetical protein PKA64_05675 [Myxococcota bacterium]|nr:hypothetical protein [Myxococcota bacterium]
MRDHPILLVLQRVEELRGQRPVVVLDLDSTLIDTAHRHLRIAREFCAEHPDTSLTPAIAALTPSDVGWSVEDALAARGCADARALAALRRYWSARFFQDAYCRDDLPTRGAPELTRALWARGATLCYLSARPARTMGEGTLHALRRWGMPALTARTVIYLKADPSQPDHAFKGGALDELDAMGTIAATFENEPGHCNTFAARFPDAVHVLVETCHSPTAPPLDPGVLRVRDLTAPPRADA